MDLNLKPKTIEKVEESFHNLIFLPPHFDTLDLHKLVLSKLENCKAKNNSREFLEHPENSIEHLIIHLLEMKRIQRITIQKERPRKQTNFCALVVTEQHSPFKAIPKMRWPKVSFFFF